MNTAYTVTFVKFDGRRISFPSVEAWEEHIIQQCRWTWKPVLILAFWLINLTERQLEAEDSVARLSYRGYFYTSGGPVNNLLSLLSSRVGIRSYLGKIEIRRVRHRHGRRDRRRRNASALNLIQ